MNRTRNIYTPVQPLSRPRTVPHGIKLLFVVCLVLLCGLGGTAGWHLADEAEAVGAVAGAQIGHTAVSPLHTNTAQPSATPKFTHTPYPTFTPTLSPAASFSANVEDFSPTENISHNTQNIPIMRDKVVEVEYIKITQLVTVVVTPVPITKTPRPTNTPDARPHKRRGRRPSSGVVIRSGGWSGGWRSC